MSNTTITRPVVRREVDTVEPLFVVDCGARRVRDLPFADAVSFAKRVAQGESFDDVERDILGGQEYQGCECEIDWNCGCGRYGGATWLEVRYEGRDD